MIHGNLEGYFEKFRKIFSCLGRAFYKRLGANFFLQFFALSCLDRLKFIRVGVLNALISHIELRAHKHQRNIRSVMLDLRVPLQRTKGGEASAAGNKKIQTLPSL